MAWTEDQRNKIYAEDLAKVPPPRYDCPNSSVSRH